MIRLEDGQTREPEVRYALSVVVDCARLLPSETPDAVPVGVRGNAGTAERLEAGTQLRVTGAGVEIDADALRLLTRIAGAVDEQRSTAADKHGRVPPTENWIARHGLERDPVIDRFGAALRSAVIAAAGSRRVALLAPWPAGYRWAMAMTHDLDVVAWWPLFTGLRVAELAKKGKLGAAATSIASALANGWSDPVRLAMRRVLDIERAAGIRSTWFIITGTPTLATFRAGDITYSPESRAARALVAAARDAGHEIGLHGSFETWTHAERFAAQRVRLEQVAGTSVAGVRQHFVRMRPGLTHQAMRAAGFRYDSTFGFSDRNGFRTGLTVPVPQWDDALRRGLAIESVPFCWMDRSLSKYRGIEDPSAWVEDAIALARVVREVEGLWTGIWHPNLATPLGYPGATDAFADLCGALMAEKPWSATLREIVEWRAARRSARAVGVGPDGTVILRADAASSQPVRLEDAAGRDIPSRPA